jgi:hypothetical protein
VPEDIVDKLTEVESELKRGWLSDLPTFLDWLAATGRFKESTARSYQTAVTQILASVSGSAGADVREVDVDRWCRAFTQKRADLSETTVSTYETRFRKGVLMYREWLSDPEKPVTPPTRGDLARSIYLGFASNGPADVTPVLDGDGLARAARRRLGVDRRMPELVSITYPFPLADGRVAHLQLPHPLPRADAERLSQFVLTLATDRPPDNRLIEPEIPEVPDVKKKQPKRSATTEDDDG